MYLEVYKFSTITVTAVFTLPQSATLDTQQNSWNPFKIIWQL